MKEFSAQMFLVDEMVSQMHGCWSETRFVVRQSRDTDWETVFSGY